MSQQRPIAQLFVIEVIIVFASQLSASGNASFATSVAVSFPSPAYCTRFGIYEALAVPITINFENFTFVVFGVFHNSAGETLEITTSTLSSFQSWDGIVYLVFFLANGRNYSTNIFVWTISGAALSPEENTICVTSIFTHGSGDLGVTIH